MSLIDEALKRAQAAHEGETRPGSGARPWTPVPLPDRTEARRRTALRAAGVVALASAIVAAAWLLRPDTKGSPPPGRPTAVPAPPAPLEEVIVAPPSRGVSAAQPTRGPAAVAAARPAAPAGAGPASSSPAPAPASAPPGRLAPALSNGHTYVGSISLPGGAKIELGGIVYSESNATALVNGRIVGTGAYIEGFTVIHIEQTRLELEGNGLTIFLSLR